MPPETVLWPSLLFSILRGVAVIAGIAYQALVTRQRYREKQRVAAMPDAPAVECIIQQWHFERGCLLLTAHIVLLLLSLLAAYVRINTPLHEVSPTDGFARILADLSFTLVVGVLTAVSVRARHYHLRIAETIDKDLGRT